MNIKTIRNYLFCLVLFSSVPLLTLGQDSLTTGSTKPFRALHTAFVGLQIPLNYTVGYRLQFSRRLSVQAQGGLIAAPLDRYTLKLLEGFGLDPTLSGVINRSFLQGSSASLGITFTPIHPGMVRYLASMFISRRGQ